MSFFDLVNSITNVVSNIYQTANIIDTVAGTHLVTPTRNQLEEQIRSSMPAIPVPEIGELDVPTYLQSESIPTDRTIEQGFKQYIKTIEASMPSYAAKHEDRLRSDHRRRMYQLSGTTEDGVNKLISAQASALEADFKSKQQEAVRIREQEIAAAAKAAEKEAAANKVISVEISNKPSFGNQAPPKGYNPNKYIWR
jgi:hypothetical protein